MNQPGLRYRVNDEAITMANEQVREGIEAEAKLGDVFFRGASTYNMGGGIPVVMCCLCEEWCSPANRIRHLADMHGFKPSVAQVKQVETMHALGADIRDIASAIGVRV